MLFESMAALKWTFEQLVQTLEIQETCNEDQEEGKTIKIKINSTLFGIHGLFPGCSRSVAQTIMCSNSFSNNHVGINS